LRLGGVWMAGSSDSPGSCMTCGVFDCIFDSCIYVTLTENQHAGASLNEPFGSSQASSVQTTTPQLCSAVADVGDSDTHPLPERAMHSISTGTPAAWWGSQQKHFDCSTYLGESHP
jgi:hypothetical protein